MTTDVRPLDRSTDLGSRLVNRWGRAGRLALSGALALLFAWRDVDWLTFRLENHPNLFLPGSDTRVYYRAADAWLTGGDPWLAHLGPVYYGAPPPTLLTIAPLLIVSERAAVWILGLAGLAAAIYVLRRSSLPLWWLLFPPLFTSIWLGGLNVLVLAALLGGAPALAIIGKAFALPVVLLQGRWLAIIVAGCVVLITIPFLPWAAFLDHGMSVVPAQAKGYSAWTNAWLLVPPVAASLVVLGRTRAAWLLVPALWPYSQPQYSIFALPAMNPLLAIGMSFTEPWTISAAIIGSAAFTIARTRLRSRTPSSAGDIAGGEAEPDATERVTAPGWSAPGMRR